MVIMLLSIMVGCKMPFSRTDGQATGKRGGAGVILLATRGPVETSKPFIGKGGGHAAARLVLPREGRSDARGFPCRPLFIYHIS